MGSMIAQFRQEQAEQEASARLALYGIAAVATHQSITKRMMIGAERILQMIQEGKQEEAIRLMETRGWC